MSQTKKLCSHLATVGDPGDHQLGDTDSWRLRVSGDVANELELSIADLALLPQCTVQIPVQCVSSGNIRRNASGGLCSGAVQFRGVCLTEIAAAANIDPAVQCVRFISAAPGGCGPQHELHDTAIDLAHCLSPQQVLLATSLNDQPLPYINGGPLRSVVQQRYFYKSLKWLSRIEFTRRTMDQCQGTWERYAGYHNAARIALGEKFQPFFKVVDDNGVPQPVEDPQQTLTQMLSRGDVSRVVVAQLNPPKKGQAVSGMLPDFADQITTNTSLRFTSEPGAIGRPGFAAAMRGIDFREKELAGWPAAYVNFSLCKFFRIDLRNADLRRCDFEGAKFLECDLTGANLAGAYLAGAAFYNCDLSGADLSSANVNGAVFQKPGGAVSSVREARFGEVQGMSPALRKWLIDNGAVL